MNLKLNEHAYRLAREGLARAEQLGVVMAETDGGACLVDCGIESPGGLEAGCWLAEICLAGMGRVAVEAGDPAIWRGPWIRVTTDRPVAACMASQYAGWPLHYGHYFAMGSGPMRAARGREPLFEKIGHVEQSHRAVGVLEAARLPTSDVIDDIARQCHVEPDQLLLLVAPTSSLAGTVQIVARSVETALHKLCELQFDLARVVAGHGIAPLPPVAANDLQGIGRTNDAILYGARVTLWVRGDDASLREFGPRIPSCSSPDYGEPFAAIFERYQRDFYRIDPLLFSPAEVHLVNIDSGSMFSFGEPQRATLAKSFLPPAASSAG